MKVLLHFDPPASLGQWEPRRPSQEEMTAFWNKVWKLATSVQEIMEEKKRYHELAWTIWYACGMLNKLPVNEGEAYAEVLQECAVPEIERGVRPSSDSNFRPIAWAQETIPEKEWPPDGLATVAKSMVDRLLDDLDQRC